MNLQPQLRRARKRWGDKALVQRALAGRYRTGQCTACGKLGCRRKWDCKVGRLFMGSFFEILGQGHSWKEAWADADAKESRR